MLLLVVVAIGAIGVFVGRSIAKGTALGAGVVCWCVTVAECHHADTLQGWNGLIPAAVSGLCALLGLGLFIGASSNAERDGALRNVPLDPETARAAERFAARMARLRALEHSVPDYSQTASDKTAGNRTDTPKEPDPPSQ